MNIVMTSLFETQSSCSPLFSSFLVFQIFGLYPTTNRRCWQRRFKCIVNHVECSVCDVVGSDKSSMNWTSHNFINIWNSQSGKQAPSSVEAVSFSSLSFDTTKARASSASNGSANGMESYTDWWTLTSTPLFSSVFISSCFKHLMGIS